MASIAGHNPAAGPQMANRYPFVGPNYQKYGEQKGFVYDPYSDQYYKDPKVQKEMLQQQGVIPQDPEKPSLLETVAPIAAVGGAYVIGNEGGKKIMGMLGAGDEAAKATTNISSTVPTPNLISAGRVPTPATASPVGTAANGGTLMSDGSVVTDQLPAGAEVTADGSIISPETGAVVGRVVQGALGAYQIYQGVGEFKDDKIGGGLSIASGAANVGAAFGSTTAGSLAGPLMAAKGGYDTFNSFQNNGENIRGSMGTLGAGVGTILGGPLGAIPGAIAGNALGYGIDKLGGLGLYHENTRQTAQRHTGELLEQSTDDKTYQDYVKGMREQHNYDPEDPSKPFHGGQYATWEEYKAAGLDPADLTGVYGNIKTFGSEWAKLSQEQRVAVSKALIDADLYSPKKGEVEITDPDRAKLIKDSTLRAFKAGAPGPTQPPQQPPAAPQQTQALPPPAQQPPPIPRPIAQQQQSNQPTGMLDVQGAPPPQQAPPGINPKFAGVGSQPTGMMEPKPPVQNDMFSGGVPVQSSDPNDPNTYTRLPNGQIMGTLIGFKPSVENPQFSPVAKPQAGITPGVPAPIDGMFTINGKPQQIKYPSLGGYR